MPIILSITALFSLLLLCALIGAGSAHALTVEIEAPDDLKPLLTQHLEAARAARLGKATGEAPGEEELVRLRAKSLESARELLATEGYFSPNIDSVMTRTENDHLLRFTVSPGPLTRVRAVNISFSGALAAAEPASQRRRARIERQFALQPPMPFRQADWDAAKTAVLRPLLAAAYPAAQLSLSQARIDPATQTADLSLNIDSGPAFYYGTPQISGQQRYPASIIQKLNPLKPGQPVRQQDLLDFQQALEESGYFTQAVVRIEPDPAVAAAAPIRVEVVERPLKLFSIGAGVSTDQGARTKVSWLHRNVLERGLRLKLESHLEEKRQDGLVELAWPRSSDGFDNSLGFQVEKEDIEGQETQTSLVIAKRSRIKGSNRSNAGGEIEVTQALQYQTEKQRVGNLLTSSNQAMTANLGWTRRRVGRAFYPRQGDVFSGQIGGASAAVLSDTSFLRLYGRYTRYFPAGEHGRLILRGELGSVLADTLDGIPTDFLFRAGGDNSVRGYAYQSLGRAEGGGVASVRHLATGSIEYNYFFTGNWGMALFVDAGDAADRLENLSPVFGVGIGSRYRSPVGPINLDLAYGEATDELRLHFSLGVSF
jgi:translocation and assembly module TamA